MYRRTLLLLPIYPLQTNHFFSHYDGIRMLLKHLYALLAAGATLSQTALLLPREGRFVCPNHKYLTPSCCKKPYGNKVYRQCENGIADHISAEPHREDQTGTDQEQTAYRHFFPVDTPQAFVDYCTARGKTPSCCGEPYVCMTVQRAIA